MTVYGTELSFKVQGDDAADLFEDAISDLGAAQGFFSIDAVLSAGQMNVLVGINVPDNTNADEYFAAVVAGVLIPALESAGIVGSRIEAVSHVAAMAV